MTSGTIRLGPFVAAVLLGVLAGRDAGAQIAPQPIPPGYGFPTGQAIIDAWIAAGDETAMRGHAWDLWAGMNAPSGQVYEGQDLPVWETWLGTGEVFSPTKPVAAAGSGPSRAFVAPHQFSHHAGLRAAGTPADDGQVVSFNKFSPEAADFIKAGHPGPGGQTYSYDSQSSLQALNAAWPAGTAPEDRGIVDFPTLAIETKPVLGLVKAAGLTAQPLWQGLAGSTNRTNPTPDTWTTCVLIDPQGAGAVRPATRQEVDGAGAASGLSCGTWLYGPLSLFYNFPMSAGEAAAFNAAQGQNAQAGDFAVLLAMHVNTKEIPFWTWQTYWWQPGGDTPGGFPGSKAGMPTAMPAPFDNYAMCTAYSQTTTPDGGTMRVCFNPYLETSPGIPAGITSNCVSCHGTARIAASPGDETYPETYDAPIPFFTDPSYFATTTHTDFSWAIPAAP